MRDDSIATANGEAMARPLHIPGNETDMQARFFKQLRGRSLAIAQPLSAEDQAAQSMPDASPTKWHLAHTTWFFETFVLSRFDPGYRVFDARFGYLFNSYYNGVSAQFPRPKRGLLTRPGLDAVHAYRRHVDDAMLALLANTGDDEIWSLTRLGLQHEEQHQELMLTDIKHLLAQNPLAPAPFPPAAAQTSAATPAWHAIGGGEYHIGNDGENGDFAFDHEGPRHRVLLDDFSIQDQPVANRDYCAFIDDGGYKTPSLWLADGWDQLNRQGWHAPLYWRRHQDSWRHYSLHGERPLDMDAPVSHISYYEAAAYAAWAGARLPSEAEWEIAAQTIAGLPGQSLKLGMLEPVAATSPSFLGGVWQWTSSPYVAYPRYRPPEGAIGEYNGKFMANQMVLRGGSCLTPPGHTRASYRNFFPPAARWQMTGLRLARAR